MATTDRSAETAADLAAAVDSAGFVRLVVRADGDALAAAGVLARTLSDLDGVPFQVSVGTTVAERTARIAETDPEDAATIAVGAVDASAEGSTIASLAGGVDRPASVAACDLADDLRGADGSDAPDRDRILVLALAGAFAAGVEPGAGETGRLLEAAADRGLVERRPGVAVPTADPLDGLAHSTLVRAPWSGDRAATREALEAAVGVDDGADPDGDDAAARPPVDEDARRRIASLVAIDAVGDGEAADSDRAAHALGRTLRPYATPSAPFATIGGYADVLEATARVRPGTSVALAMGHGGREAALDAWREHGRAAHAALDGASTGRYDGLFVVGVDGADVAASSAPPVPVGTVARLAAAYRSPEPVVLAIDGDGGEAGLAATDSRSLEAALEAIARDCGAEGAYDAGPGRGSLRYDSDEVDDGALVATTREVL